MEEAGPDYILVAQTAHTGPYTISKAELYVKAASNSLRLVEQLASAAGGEFLAMSAMVELLAFTDTCVAQVAAASLQVERERQQLLHVLSESGKQPPCELLLTLTHYRDIV